MKKIMKIKYLYVLLLFTAFSACDSDDLNDEVNALDAPENVDATFSITQDNTGTVTITPTARGAAKFQVFYGDGTPDSVELGIGQSTQRNYIEGNYPVRVQAIGINGKITEVVKDLMVSFRAPENIEITIAKDPSSGFTVNVSAMADFATMYDVTFGENPNAAPVALAAGGSISYTYAAIGTYTVTVRAFSGGSATSTATQDVTIVDPVLLPITFESPTLNYTFGDFGGAASAKADNPQIAGNNSSFVGRTLKTNGAEVFAGTVLQLDSPIDFSTLKKIRMKVLSPVANATVKMKLENATNGDIATEVDVVTSVVDQWETLLFDFTNSDLTQSYSKVIVFFDFGNTGGGDRFFFDDIEQTNQSLEKLELPINFESIVLTYTYSEFGGAPTVVVTNPFQDGINVSGNVSRTTKVSGAQPSAGAILTLDDPIDFSNNQRIALKIRSPRAGVTVKLKLENLTDGSISREVDVPTTVANQWEELVFDFGNIDTGIDYQKMVFFFDFGNAGQGEIFYFDDARFTDGSTPVRLPLTFDQAQVPYTFSSFGGANTVVATNPSPTGINTTAMVAQTTKPTGAENFAGSSIALTEPIDFSSFSKIRMKIRAPQSGIIVKLKLENLTNGNTINIERDFTNSVANQWEDAVYDFSGVNNANEYQRVVVFFDFGNNGVGSDYYFDQIELIN